MEQFNNETELLELMNGPAFTVEHGTVTCVNRQACHYGIVTGESVRVYLPEGFEEYTALESGTLYLTLQIDGCKVGATVSRLESKDVFILDPPQCQPELQAVALAARELRDPLSGILFSLDRLMPLMDTQNPTTQKQAALLNRNLHKLLRLLGNMSDAARTLSHCEYRNITDVAGEIFEKAAAYTEKAGVKLCFENLKEPVFIPVDAELLERAIYNLLSNSIKFSQGGAICAKLSRSGNKLQLRIKDSGSGIPDDVYGTVFSRHLRNIHPEDRRYGIGLGMVLVRNAAAVHGGTVLVQRLPEGGTCVTITLSIRRYTGSNVTSPIRLPDYTGGFDHALTELADVLPPEVYQWK